MANHRRSPINDAVAQELTIGLRSVRDPRVTENFVTVTRAEVSPDLRNATVYYSCMGDQKEVRRGLDSCSGVLRRHLAQTLNLRITPELNFVKDGYMEHGARIAKLLEDIKTSDENN